MMPEYDELQNLLGSMNSGIRAPECHGFLTGFLCISGGMHPGVWEYLCADLDGAETLSGSQQAVLLAMGEDIHARLRSTGLDFQPLQPEDDAPFAERCDAMAQWCQGFLSGLGVAGTIDWGSLSDQCQEMIADFSDISRLSAADDNRDIREREASLNELYEYVRIGVVFIHDEFAALKAQNENPGVVH